MEITINVTRNRESLHYGDGYAVLYYDVERQEAALRVGIWRGPEFDFPTMKLKQKPVMKPKTNEDGVVQENYVLGWYRLKDWNEEVNEHFECCAPV